jgi:hypothetical protein
MSGLRQVLLLVQAAIAGLVAAEVLLLAAVGHSVALLGLAALTGSLALVPVAVAVGLAAGWGRSRSWARGLGVAYELLLLVSGWVDVALVGNGDLVAVLAGVALPLALLWLLRHGAERHEWVPRYSPESREPSDTGG